jgi:hypothetical protein
MAIIELPIVEAAPQDVHDITSPGAQQTVLEWRSLPHVRRERVGDNIGVGVVDTAVDNTHPWFAGLVRGDPADDDVSGLLLNNNKAGHATFVAGLVLEQAPAANVVVQGALAANGQGATETVIEKALELVRGKQPDGRHTIDILNLSLGCYGTETEKAQFEKLLDDMWAENPNLIVVAAAGNKRPDQTGPFYPAALSVGRPNLVAVGAACDLTATQWAEFSNQGSNVTFRVCGVGLVSTFLRFTTQSGNPDGRWATWGGTSFSTAIVSGMIAARMAPGDGAQAKTGPEAVADLLGNAAWPVSIPVGPFPAPTGDMELQQAGDGSLTVNA